jgi:hypothetical protein
VSTHDDATSQRPVLAIVTGGSSTEAESTAPPEPNVVRSATIGAAIGFTVMTVAITLAGTICGLGFAGSFGLGLFVGIWGGIGSGFMVGATVPLARYLDAISATHPHQPTQGANDDDPTG